MKSLEQLDGQHSRVILAIVSIPYFVNQTTIGGHLSRFFCGILMFPGDCLAILSIRYFENQTTSPVHQCSNSDVRRETTLVFVRATLSIFDFLNQTTRWVAEDITSYALLG